MPNTQILVIAAPGQLQEGLQVLLATLPDTAVVLVADAGSALALVARLQPQLVLVAGGDGESTLCSLRETYHQAHFLVLVENARQVAPVRAAGADTVLVEGIPASRLLAHVRQLLAEASDHSKEVRQ